MKIFANIFFSILFFLTLFSTFFLKAQLEKADKYYESKQYYNAINLYKKILDKSTDNKQKEICTKKIADAYWNIGNFSEAKHYYEIVYNNYTIDTNYVDKLLNCIYKTGDCELIRKIVNENKEKARYEKIFDKYLHKCIYNENLDSNNQYVVFNEKELNSSENDFSPFIVREKLWFTSSRKLEENSIYYVNGQGFENFWISSYDSYNKIWENPKIAPKSINSKFNNGTATFDKNKNILYFTLCNGLNGKKKNCSIYYTFIDPETGEAGNIELLKLGQNMDNTGHPTLFCDGKKMIFVSDSKLGYGKTDLWFVEKDSFGNWKNPINLGGHINTKGNEMFPVVVDDTLLYFSSDGQPDNIGGLDIYYSLIRNENFTSPQHLPKPFNSTADDFGIIFFGKDSGLFCSNRSGGYGGDDIYSFYKLKPVFVVKGKVVEKGTNLPIGNAIVSLQCNDNLIDSVLSDNNGNFIFKIPEKSICKLFVNRYGYLSDSREINIDVSNNDWNKHKSTVSKRNTKIFINKEENFELQKIVREEIEIKNIYYDFDKWELRELSKKELDKLAKLLSENKDIKIIINSHTDEQGKDDYNLQLSEKRAISVVEYLKEKGISSERMSYKGWGESMPVVRNAKTEEEHQLNRRTTFTILNVNELLSEEKKNNYEKISQSLLQANKSKNLDLNEGGGKQIFFKIQVGAAKKQLSNNYLSKIEEILQDVEIESVKSPDGFYRYYAGRYKDYEKALLHKEKLSQSGFECFIVAFKGNEQIDVNTAKKLIVNEKDSN